MKLISYFQQNHFLSLDQVTDIAALCRLSTAELGKQLDDLVETGVVIPTTRGWKTPGYEEMVREYMKKGKRVYPHLIGGRVDFLEFIRTLDRLEKRGEVKCLSGNYGSRYWETVTPDRTIARDILASEQFEFTESSIAKELEYPRNRVMKVLEDLVQSGKVAPLGFRKVRGRRYQLYSVVRDYSAKLEKMKPGQVYRRGPLIDLLGLSEVKGRRLIDYLVKAGRLKKEKRGYSRD